MNSFKLSPCEQCIYDKLADGLNHKKNELFLCIDNELSSKQVVNVIISQIRTKIRPYGLDIVCVLGYPAKNINYRMVRSFKSSD